MPLVNAARRAPARKNPMSQICLDPVDDPIWILVDDRRLDQRLELVEEDLS
ncbi:MAG: hypothetical protein ACR65U_13705 [Methylocystis sp.]